ncbi:probable G-protein coupled receptor 139 [Microcaecilia unicolor]|uniref:Probable G-protein coupled receptor 139 n=1 Tax=Microcaecilia unicolor TaxID=1415580 RepID=A0A6P7ZV91_9AMPH|nr:probable G-protein coupled receptor 139 [Microcaecilia unicolor]
MPDLGYGTNNNHWMVQVQKIFYPLLAAIGIPSNIATFLILWRKNCKLSASSRCYLMAISVADTLVLILIVVLEMILHYYTTESFWYRQPWCMIRDVFNYGAYNTSTWLVVGFTIERFIAITTVQLRTKLCTRRNALYVIASVFVCSHVCAIPYLWSNESLKDNSTGHYVCKYSSKVPSCFVEGLVWFQTTLVYIIPYIIIFLLNGLILRQICLSNKVHCERNNLQLQATRRFRSHKRKSVILLVTVSMTYAYLCTTRFVTQILIRTLHYGINRRDYLQGINVAADVGTMLDLTHCAVNMYLYACTQSHFREELVVCAKAVLYPWKSFEKPREYPLVISEI